MQDRFKFRAFDLYNKKMFYDVQNEYDYTQGNCISETFGTLLNDKGFIIMQCTGLKDKNGNLIYEGDILERTNDLNKKIGVVKYDDNFLQFRASNMSLFSMTNRSIVIGNIYDTPDIINGKNQYD